MRLLFWTLAILGTLTLHAEKPLVVASASIFADMARNIGGDKIEVRSIVPIGGDPHRYEATPDDAARNKGRCHGQSRSHPHQRSHL